MQTVLQNGITIDQNVIRKTGWAQDAMGGRIVTVTPSRDTLFVEMIDGKLRRFDWTGGKVNAGRYQDEVGGVLYR